MFRDLRRSRQALSPEECGEILCHGTSGVLALAGDDGYPYAVPLSYVYAGGKLYFHCAKAGHKLDAIARNPKGSFCVIHQDQVVPETYTTHYRSVIAFGALRVLEDEGEKRAAIELLAVKYAPGDTPEHRARYIEKDWAPLCMVEMTIHHLSGKQAKELIPSQKG